MPDLVDSQYATPGNIVYSIGKKMFILKPDGAELGSFNVIVETCLKALPESNCGLYVSDIKPEGVALKPEGLLQRYSADMQFGLMSYSYGKEDQGGVVRFQIKDLSVDTIINDKGGINAGQNMINFINEYEKKGWDPLAEMFYDAVRYLRGNSYAQAAYCPTNQDENKAFEGCTSTGKWVDPVTSWCQKNNIIIINDEYPSMEHDSIPYSVFNPTYTDTPQLTEPTRVPAEMMTYNPDVVALLADITRIEGLAGATGRLALKVGSTDDTCRDQTIDNLADFSGICPKEKNSQGTFSLAAIAYDAFKNDMRLDLDNIQQFRTYAIAFRATDGTYQVPPPPLNPMYLAGKYGNYDEQNNIVGPDLPEEWMKSAALCTRYPKSDNCLPKGFFYAEGGDKIEAAIIEVFESILRRSASGTSVSVLATSGQGEGNLVQAYYRPARSEATVDGARDVVWTGYLQSLWVDKQGNLREDSNKNHKLDIGSHKIIKYIDKGDGTIEIGRYLPTPTNPYPDTTGESIDKVALDKINTLWEAGAVLSETDSNKRNILTGIDQNFDGVVKLTEMIPFTIAETDIYPYLALQPSASENGSGQLGKLEDARIRNLIAFIRGDDPKEGKSPTPFEDPANLDLRDRRIDITDDGVDNAKVWKLGDIINSTPISISSPTDRFDLIYGDASYGDFYQQYKKRETMVYVGANDGMLHAFTSWRYNKTTQQFEDPAELDSSLTSVPIGSEVWAYIPQNLLPHLKWLSRPDYTHVHYMDMQPRIIDARIFDDDDVHPNGWGTVMIVGMNTGGGLSTLPVDLDGDGAFEQLKPSYMVFDITEPRNPTLLWEKTYDGLGFTRSTPTVIRIGPKLDVGDWFLAFGNGPDAGSAGTNPNYDGESILNGRIYIVDLKTGVHHSSTSDDWWAEVADPKAFFNTPNAFDWKLNHNVDAVYMATTSDSETRAGDPPIWQGSVYRILTQNSPLDPTAPVYLNDPAFWTLEKIFNSPRPITAQGALSTDGLGNVWIYYGTGRYLNFKDDGDEITTDTEYLIGLKDPYFNKNYATSTTVYYHEAANNKVLEVDDLMDATPIVVLNTGEVLCYDGSYSAPDLNIATGFDPATSQPCGSGSGGIFNDLLKFAQAKDGWIRAMPDDGASAQRNLNRPAVLGGLTYFTTFTPTADECSYGGNSTLWTLYYETGTAYKRATFTGDSAEELLTDGSGRKRVVESISLGSGAASAIGFHLGGVDDAPPKPFVQMGSGAILEPEESDPPASVGSGLRSWRERD
jgi:type IV pilus assembly protein PilY1